jgi:imidazolonepropionase-like amidohydrolase
MRHYFALPRLALTIALLGTLSISSAVSAATLLENVDIYSPNQAVRQKTAILFDQERIIAIGEEANRLAAGATRIDGKGQRVYPGLINANSSLGLMEVEALRASIDTAEVGENNANARAQIALHADSELIPVARAGGVTHSLSVPDGGVIAGQSSLMRLSGWTYEELSAQSDLAMHVFWPSTRLPSWLPKAMIEQATKDAANKLLALERAFEQAQVYAKRSPGQNEALADPRLAALQKVLNGQQKLFVHANEIAQIRAALNFAERFKLRITLVGAQDAWRLADELKARNVSVILGSPFSAPMRRSEGFDATYGASAKLAKAGVRFAIATDLGGMDAALIKNLPYLAGHAAAYGLSDEQALHAMTLGPAEILGVADRMGSIEVGKQANLIVTDGDILEIQTRVHQMFIDGQVIALDSKHDGLCQRYQGRYRTVARDACKR